MTPQKRHELGEVIVEGFQNKAITYREPYQQITYYDYWEEAQDRWVRHAFRYVAQSRDIEFSFDRLDEPHRTMANGVYIGYREGVAKVVKKRGTIVKSHEAPRNWAIL